MGIFAPPSRRARWRSRCGARLRARRREAQPLQLVALGDSLTAGYGLPPGQAFPDVLQRALKARGLGRRGRQRRRLRRHRRRRAGALRLERAGGHGRADRRTRRQRHAARHADPAAAEAALGANPRQGARTAHIATLLAGMRAAPELRRRLQAALRRDLSRSRPALTASRSIRSFSTASPATPSSIRSDGLHPTREGVEQHRRGDPAGGRGACWRKRSGSAAGDNARGARMPRKAASRTCAALLRRRAARLH